jgi:hypothetical protein
MNKKLLTILEYIYLIYKTPVDTTNSEGRQYNDRWRMKAANYELFHGNSEKLFDQLDFFVE